MYLLELVGDHDRFAAREAENAASEVQVIATGLATASAINPDRARGLALTRVISEYLGESATDHRSVRGLLEVVGVDRSGSVAVRTRTVRGSATVDSQVLERKLGSLLVEYGLTVDLTDPDHELRVVAADGRCYLGWTVLESRRDFEARQPTEKPFFKPGSMDAMEARAIANLAGAGPETTVLDPMCGTGGLLIEAGLLGASVFGIDAQSEMVAGAAENCSAYLPGRDWSLFLGDAGRLPFRASTLDAALLDTPYGRQSRIQAADVQTLLSDTIPELHRVLDRAVVVTDRPIDRIARNASWTVEDRFDRRVHRSLTRRITILERSPSEGGTKR